MSNAVIQVSPATIDQMKQKYNRYLQSKVPTGAVFTAKPPGCTITAYKSGKVLFQGKTASDEASQWGSEQPSKAKKSSTPQKKSAYSPPANISELSIIGSDEVGTGDYFGPITVVAAFAAKEQLELLKELGVKDSKALKDPQIVQIAKDIIQVIPYTLLVLHNEKYNELQAKGMSQGKMKALLHNQALLKLQAKLGSAHYDGILIDQFAEPSTYYNYIKDQKNQVKENVYFSTQGEGVHLAVAAASIIARYSFIQQMDKLSKLAGFDIPKGAGSQVDIAAAKLIQAKGEQALRTFTKLHFANTMKAKKLAKR
ncbi:ribonuclease HIII [Anaerobacillus sp. MEB173]|uniref:ribonuclease HIII n=1 Tax=Anaerobacillus sp. MEB173 TaxID=3383345 RepID=UPI003F93125E